MEILPPNIAGDQVGRSRNFPDNPAPWYVKPLPSPVASISGLPIQSGVVTPGNPSEAPVSTTGVYVKSFFDDWYYRIHIYPSSFNLGNLAGDQQRTLKLWNAFLTTVNVTVENLVNGEGIVYTSDYPLPGTLPPLRQIAYSFSISANGPPVIDAEMVWVIDGVTYTTSFTGRRAVFFGLQPDWRTPFREVMTWKTIISQAYSGIEQRTSVRRNPRLRHEFQIRVQKDNAILMDQLMFGWQGRFFAVPLWHEKVSLSTQAVVGDDELTVSTTSYRSFSQDQTIVLWKAPGVYELAQIQSIAGNVLTLTGALASTWPAGTRVYPCTTAKMNEDMTVSRALPTHIDALMSFNSSPTDFNPRLPVAAAPFTYRGEELYIGKNNWRNSLQSSFNASETSIDFGTGPIRVYRKADLPTKTRSFLFFSKNRQTSELYREFFIRRMGRLKPVWMPSGTMDFYLAANAQSLNSFIVVRKSEYPSLINENVSMRDIIILLRDGSYIARRITDSAVFDANNDVLNLDAALGKDFTPADVKLICMLGLYRLSSDEIVFIWHNDEVVEIDTSFTLTKPAT